MLVAATLPPDLYFLWAGSTLVEFPSRQTMDSTPLRSPARASGLESEGDKVARNIRTRKLNFNRAQSTCVRAFAAAA